MSKTSRTNVNCPMCKGILFDVTVPLVAATGVKHVECDTCHASFAIKFEVPNDNTRGLIDFHRMCVDHDLTYAFADDPRAYNRGQESYQRIVEAAKHLPRDAARAIWNEQVDAKIMEGSRHLFYWEGS